MSGAHEPIQAASDWDITTDVGLTALGVAAGRAAETARDDRLCADPYAESLVAAAPAPVALPTRLTEPDDWDSELAQVWLAMAVHMGLRTRFFDDYLAHASDMGVRQVVILAAGLDTRPVRLRWPSETRVFELDQPKVLRFKDRVLAEDGVRSACERYAVPIDLRADWPCALAEAGFDRDHPTAWLAEGILPYLPEQDERDFFARIATLSAPGSRLAANESRNLANRWWQDPRFARLIDNFGLDPTHWWHSESTRPAPDAWFSERGWTVAETTGEQLAQQYQRRLPAEESDLFASRSRYYTAALPSREGALA